MRFDAENDPLTVEAYRLDQKQLEDYAHKAIAIRQEIVERASMCNEGDQKDRNNDECGQD